MPYYSSTVQQFHFPKCTQKGRVAKFIASLRHLPEACEFGGTLKYMLKDRLVCGLQDPRIQHQLLAESNLSLSKAFELAQSPEAAENGVHSFQLSQTDYSTGGQSY